MLYLRVFTVFMIIGFIYCAKIELEEELDNRHRTKRQVNNTNPGVGGLNEVEQLVTEIKHDIRYTTATYSDINPVKSISTFRVPADSQHQDPIELVAAMMAVITRTHYDTHFGKRDTISSEVYQHLINMDKQTGDEAGHLLASSLGGTSARYNFAPQGPMLNRAVNIPGSILPQPGWYDVEEMLRDYLKKHRDGRIHWNLVVEYSLLPGSRRPTAFLLSIRFYKDQSMQLDNWKGDGAVRSYRFQNVPVAASTNPNHTWWNHQG